MKSSSKSLSPKISPKNSPKTPSKYSQKSSSSTSPSIKKSPNSKKIQELRLLHRNAIDKLDFLEAENIEKQIFELKAGTQNDQISAIKSEFEEAILNHINYYKQKLAEIIDTKESNDYDFRVQINTSFENLKLKQMNEMADLEKVYANDRLKETQRLSPDYENLILRAKSAGALHDYKLAAELQNSAFLVSQSYLDKRLAQVDKDYEAKNEALMQKHTKEIILLVRRLESGLQKIIEKSEKAQNQEKNILDSKLINEYKKVSRKIQLQANEISSHLQEIDQSLSQILVENSIDIPKILCESVKNSTKFPLTYLPNSPK